MVGQMGERHNRPVEEVPALLMEAFDPTRSCFLEPVVAEDNFRNLDAGGTADFEMDIALVADNRTQLAGLD